MNSARLDELKHSKLDGGVMIELSSISNQAIVFGWQVWEGPEDTRYKSHDLRKNKRGEVFRPCTAAISTWLHALWYGPIGWQILLSIL